MTSLQKLVRLRNVARPAYLFDIVPSTTPVWVLARSDDGVNDTSIPDIELHPWNLQEVFSRRVGKPTRGDGVPDKGLTRSRYMSTDIRVTTISKSSVPVSNVSTGFSIIKPSDDDDVDDDDDDDNDGILCEAFASSVGGVDFVVVVDDDDDDAGAVVDDDDDDDIDNDTVVGLDDGAGGGFNHDNNELLCCGSIVDAAAADADDGISGRASRFDEKSIFLIYSRAIDDDNGIDGSDNFLLVLVVFVDDDDDDDDDNVDDDGDDEDRRD
jgi:hypothetical protein